MCCAGEQLIGSAGRNDTCTSKDAVVEFVEAIGQWVEESLLKRLRQAPFHSLMANECTDFSTVEELSTFCRWVEDGLPVEHCIEIIPLKKAEAIHTTLVDCVKQKNIQWNQPPRHFFKTTSKSLPKVCFAYFIQRLYVS